MGIFSRPSGGSEPSGRIAMRSSRSSGGGVCADIRPGEPRPTNFKLVSYLAFGAYVVVEIVYPDCKNFEGHKILVYDDAKKFAELFKTGSVDPHFFEHVYSPVARFEPTDRGRSMAIAFATAMSAAKEG